MRAVLIYLLYGLVSIFVQVILIRRLLSVFYGNELTIGALFAGWMFWTALGGYAFAKRADRTAFPDKELALILILCAVLFVLSGAFTWLIKYIFKVVEGEALGFGTILLAGFLFTAPVCFLLGAGFNYSAKLFEADETNLVRLYLWEAVGSAIAGIVFSLFIAGRVGAFFQTVLCAFLTALAGAIALTSRKSRLFASIGCVLVALAFAGLSSAIEKKLVELRWKNQKVLYESESKYATLSVTKREELVNFWIDGFPAFSYPDQEHFEKIIHLPLAMCAHPEKVLLIGGGLAGAVKEVFKHRVKKLVYVQIDPKLTELEERYIPELKELEKVYPVKIYHQDARIFLKRTKERFDAIILNLPDPETAHINRYYTQEFYQLAKSHLKKDGVLGLTLGTSGNYLSDGQASLLANGVLTLKAVFKKVVILPLGQNYLVAGDTSPLLTADAEKILAQLKKRQIKTYFVREYYLKDNLSEERLLFVQMRLEHFINQPKNTDLKPRGYYLSSLLWLEQTNPRIRGILKKILLINQKPLYVFLGVYFILALVLVGFWGGSAFSALSIFAVGLIGIGAELVLMLGFQVVYGYVYQLVGGLVSGFMVGLVIGAWLYQRYKDFWQKGRTWTFSAVLAGEMASIGLSWLGLFYLVRITPSAFITISLILGLLILVAFFSGICFPLSAFWFQKISGKGMGATAGWINASDHLGSALGAFLTSAILIPIFGLGVGLGVFAVILASSLFSILLVFRAFWP